MNTSEPVTARLASSIGELRLLEHPFYKRWQNGELELSELASYAEQYRHFEKSLPAFLEATRDCLPEGEAHQLVVENLDDELGPPSHVDLFDTFMDATGADSSVEATPATKALLASYDEALAQGPAAALGALAAYEVQSPAIAASKGGGLRSSYGFDAAETKFWDVHATVDLTHAEWVVAGIESLDDADTSINWARKTAEAWWAFLDEREAARPRAA